MATDYEQARDEIHDVLTADDRPPDFDSPPEAYVVEGQRHATRLLRRLARLDAEAAAVKEAADDEIRLITAYRDDRLGGITRARGWLERVLEGFARANHAASNVQTVKLPSGALKLSQGRAKVVVNEDDPEVLAMLAERGWAKIVPNKADIARGLRQGPKIGETGGDEVYAAVTPDGEVFPGVTFTRPVDLVFKATPADTEGEPW